MRQREHDNGSASSTAPTESEGWSISALGKRHNWAGNFVKNNRHGRCTRAHPPYSWKVLGGEPLETSEGFMCCLHHHAPGESLLIFLFLFSSSFTSWPASYQLWSKCYLLPLTFLSLLSEHVKGTWAKIGAQIPLNKGTCFWSLIKSIAGLIALW